MTLEMRELKGDDLFALLSIVGKLDIKDEFVKMFETNAKATKVPEDHQKKEPTKAELAKQQAEADKRGMKVMANMLQLVMLNAGKIKDDMNGLFANLTGKSKKEIEMLGLKEYTSLIVNFFKKPELADFFSSITSLL